MDITIRQGETLQIPVTSDDLTAQTVRFQAGDGKAILIDALGTFEDGKATIFTNDTVLPVGRYDYMLTVVYEDGAIEKLPDLNGCEDGDCELPKLIVCQGFLDGVS